MIPCLRSSEWQKVLIFAIIGSAATIFITISSSLLITKKTGLKYNNGKFWMFPQLSATGLKTSVMSGNTIDGIEPNIFFLETSMKPTLSLREACSVESAAQHNPQQTVFLFNLKPFNFEANGYMQTLINISNVHVSTLDLSELFNNTPLYDLYQSGIFKKSSYPIHHLSDASRLALLWKLGGIYLDTDTITLRPLSGLRNALGMESEKYVASGALFFQKQHQFLNVCMTEFARDYQPDAWGYQGPELISRVLKWTCNASLLASVIGRPEVCQGIRLLPQQALLPVGWKAWKTIVTETDLREFNLTDSYMLHFYGSLSHDTFIETGSGVLLDFLASENCPQMYNWVMKNEKF